MNKHSSSLQKNEHLKEAVVDLYMFYIIVLDLYFKMSVIFCKETLSALHIIVNKIKVTVFYDQNEKCIVH
jgi:hypothetical protein